MGHAPRPWRPLFRMEEKLNFNECERKSCEYLQKSLAAAARGEAVEAHHFYDEMLYWHELMMALVTKH